MVICIYILSFDCEWTVPYVYPLYAVLEDGFLGLFNLERFEWGSHNGGAP